MNKGLNINIAFLLRTCKKTKLWLKCSIRKLREQGLRILKIKEFTFVNDCFQIERNAVVGIFLRTPLIVLLFIGFFMTSCKPEEVKPSVIYDEQGGVFICNEGNFTSGNASLSFYDFKTHEVKNQIFYNANNFPLGDVVQSMTIFNGYGYIMVNNSGKIMVIDIDNFKHVATITNLTSPRYIEFISTNKAYVSDLYSPYITIIDPSSNTRIGEIYVGHGTEQMIKLDAYLYVTSWSFNNKVYKINSNNDELVDSIQVTKQPNSIVKDKYNRIWVLSDGGYEGNPTGQVIAVLTCINTNTFEIEKEFPFSSIQTSPTELKINKAGDTLFYINGSWGGRAGNQAGVYKMSVDASELPSEPLIPEGNQLFYGLGVNPQNSDIYVSDAIDCVQKGIVFRYNADGIRLDSFKTDIIPGGFCFKCRSNSWI
ncbi:MAG: YncE family protein [Bacteroidales bacterium]|nr:YncE family protein [Bacteroidales bacterium]